MFLEQYDKINLLINIIILIVNADKLKLILIWKKYQEGKNIRLAKKKTYDVKFYYLLQVIGNWLFSHWLTVCSLIPRTVHVLCYTSIGIGTRICSLYVI